MKDEDVRSYYDNYAKIYESFYSEIQKQKISHLIYHISREMILPLDLGSGTGILSSVYSPMICLDLSIEMLREGQKRGRDMMSIAADMTSIPLRRQCIRTLISLTSIQNAADPKRAIHEIRRILNPHFLLFISILSKSRQRKLIEECLEFNFGKIESIILPPEDIAYILEYPSSSGS